MKIWTGYRQAVEGVGARELDGLPRRTTLTPAPTDRPREVNLTPVPKSRIIWPGQNPDNHRVPLWVMSTHPRSSNVPFWSTNEIR